MTDPPCLPVLPAMRIERAAIILRKAVLAGNLFNACNNTLEYPEY